MINKYNIKDNADNVGKVTDVVGDAKKYYYAGYKSSQQIADLNLLTQKLQITQEKAMQIYEIAKRRGSVQYSRQNAEIQKTFDEINEKLFK